MELPDLKLLQAAIVLSEVRNYSRAARRLGIQQPTLTKRIVELEDFVGFRLFLRSTQYVEPTDACRRLVQEAKESVFHAERAVQLARATEKGAQAVLHLGKSQYIDPYFVSMLTSVSLPLFPNFHLSLSTLSSQELELEVLLGKLDMAIIAGASEDQNITQIEIARTPFYIVLPDSIPLAKEYEITSSNLRVGARSSPLIIVRTNASTSAEFIADIAACVCPALYAIALPKVEDPKEIVAAANAIDELQAMRNLPVPVGILPTLESPRGIRMAFEIAFSSPNVIGLQVGFADLLEPLGITSGNLFARDQVRLMVRLAAGEAGLDCYDSAYPNFKDVQGYESQLRAASSMGFAGSSCIHPSQVQATNLAFTPSAEAISHARRLVDASDQAAARGEAVTTFGGKMIDRPFNLRAKRLLTEAPKKA